jgi:hypothetical protein
MMQIFRLLGLLFAFLPILAQAPVAAQIEERPNVTVYPRAFFAPNQPSNANNMVQLLPGFRIDGGNQGIRGFSGTVGNVLIDGDVPTSKEEGIDEILRRIPADAVDRIELIRAGATGIDMYGHPMLANVIRNRTSTIRGRAEVEYARNRLGQDAPSGAVHLTRQTDWDTLDVSLSYGREVQGNHGPGTRNRFSASGTVLRLSDYDQPEFQIESLGTINYRRNLFGGDLNLSGVISQEVEYSNVTERITFPALQLQPGLERERGRGIEGQLQYEYPLSAVSRARFYAIHRSNEENSRSESGSGNTLDVSLGRDSTRETVLRLDGRTEEGPVALEVGAEGAINILNSRNFLELGGVVVPLPASNVRVEEQRAEFFGTATWRISPTLTLEGGARNEISTISQSGDTNLSRTLSFFKPRGLLSWRVAPAHELRFLAEREVGQLDFGGFVSSASLINNNVQAGNQNLQPPRTTRLEATWEHRFWERASITVTLRRDFIAGLLDNMPVTVNGRTFNTRGNVGSGRRDTLEASLVLPLDRIGLTGVTVNAEMEARNTRVRDLVTGEIREFSGSEPFSGEIGFTHDIPDWNLRWGAEYDTPTNSIDYRIDEVSRNHGPSHVRAFAEYKPSTAWTIRVFGEQLTQNPSTRDRLIYTGLRNIAPLNFRELRYARNIAMFGVNLQYNFGL